MTRIPVLLLKTRSQPDDGYEEYFNNLGLEDNHGDDTASSAPTFQPQFVPVLEHRPNTTNLNRFEELLRTDTLAERYGGLIFTSQRAVEGISDAVRRIDVEKATSNGDAPSLSESRQSLSHPKPSRISATTTSPFPLYVVGPATARSLSSLLDPIPSPTLTALHPTILGAHTGTGQNLAHFILQHYNALHADLWFEYYEAPRLPFIPLIGPASGQYARQRLEPDDERLRKKGLLFLVGEVRRDVIPRTLMDEQIGRKRIDVDEWVVYETGVRHEFEAEFANLIQGFDRLGPSLKGVLIVVVVFSPQGCEAMLRVLGCLGRDGKVKEEFRRSADRWRQQDGSGRGSVWCGGGADEGNRTAIRYVVATIGPTTRDHLIDAFGFEPDVCADKPSPEGVGEGVKAFLRGRNRIC